MKNKKLNLLFVIFMCLFMSFGIEEVYAEQNGYCVYSGDAGKATAKFKTDGTYSANVDIKGDSVWNVGIKSSPLSSSPFVYDENKKIYYCPSTVFISNYGVETYYTMHGFSTAKYKDSVKLELQDSSINAIQYNVKEKDIRAGKFEPCVISDKNYDSEIANIEKKVNNLEKNISSKTYNDIKGLSEEANKLLTNIQNSDSCEPINTEKFESIYSKLNTLLGQKGEEIKQLQKRAGTDSEKKEYEQQLKDIDDIIKKNQNNQSIAQTMSSQFKLITNNIILDCNDLISEELRAVIQFILNIIRIGAPIILLVLSSLDFASAVISSDQDALKKATSKVVKRGLAIIGLFLVPTMVSISLDWIEDSYDKSNNLNCEEIYNDTNNG